MVSIPTLNDDCILQEFSGTLISCWSKDLNNTWEGKGVIPRSVRFTGKGENINVFGLESGQMRAKIYQFERQIFIHFLGCL